MNIEEIWDKYGKMIKAILSSKVSSFDNDDLLQEIFIKIINNIHTVRSDESIKSWVYQLTKNTVIDYYRKNGLCKKIVEFSENLFTNEVEDPLISLEDDLSACIQPFINELPEKPRELLTAIELKGLSQKEYATKHNINYSTVKSRLQKARNQLRKLYEDCCYLSFDKNGNIIDYEPRIKNCTKCRKC